MTAHLHAWEDPCTQMCDAYEYAPLPARRHSTDLIDPTLWKPDDPVKQRRAALNVIAWHGYPEAGTQAWDEMTETLAMCGLRRQR